MNQFEGRLCVFSGELDEANCCGRSSLLLTVVSAAEGWCSDLRADTTVRRRYPPEYTESGDLVLPKNFESGLCRFGRSRPMRQTTECEFSGNCHKRVYGAWLRTNYQATGEFPEGRSSQGTLQLDLRQERKSEDLHRTVGPRIFPGKP